MEDDKIRQAFARIKPSAAARERMLRHAFERAGSGATENSGKSVLENSVLGKRKAKMVKNVLKWALLPVAAVGAIAFVAVGARTNWGDKAPAEPSGVAINGADGSDSSDTTPGADPSGAGSDADKAPGVDSGKGSDAGSGATSSDSLAFTKVEQGPTEGVLDLGFKASVSRYLTAAENARLFGDLAAKGGFAVKMYGMFDGKTLKHVEGSAGVVRIVAAAPGVPTTDAFIPTDAEKTNLNGTEVKAAYFVDDLAAGGGAGAQGKRKVVYAASFKLNGVSVYAQVDGVEADREALKEELTKVVKHLTERRAIDFGQVNA
jgi:hypothetical protein